MPAGLPRRSPRDGEKSPSSLVIHNVVVSGRRTSVRLEPVMWEALQDIARRQERTVHDLVTQIDRERTVIPRTTPSVRVTRKPSSSNCVVTMLCATIRPAATG